MHSRLRDLLLEIHQKGMEEQKEILDETIEKWRIEGNDKQTDDILVIGMHVQL